MANPKAKKVWKCIFFTIILITLAFFISFAKGNYSEEWMLLTVASLVAQGELFWGIHHLAFSKKKPIGAPLTADKTYIAVGVLYFLFFISYLLVKRYAANEEIHRLMLNFFPVYTAFMLLFPLGALVVYFLQKNKKEGQKTSLEQETTEESKKTSKSRFWELTSAKAWIAGSLSIILILSGVYLFVIDTNRPREYKADIHKETVKGLITQLEWGNNIDILQEIHQNGVDALVHFATKEVDKSTAKLSIGHLSDEKNATYFSYQDLNAEVVFTPCYYNPLVVKWGYGWYHKEGNFYAQLFEDEQADSLPNYRNFFFVRIRSAEKNWSFSVFSKQRNVEKVLQQVILTYNQLEDVQ